MICLNELKKLLESNRSVRRFDSTRIISTDELTQLVELTRYCASGRNLQPLRYRIVNNPDECKRLFPTLAWAGYYKDWDGPDEGERPTAYLVQCLDTDLTSSCLCDDGLQLEAITLGATAMGLAGCIIKAFNKPKLIGALNLPSRYEPRYVLALGYAAEKAKIVPLGVDGDIKYYRDANSTQCVPKRPTSQLIIE
ncbi:MAG: nitroreductase family protein [Muribaculaceae bacterium]|nr:nitroreductase family protein [Muribaculaceae bacterium]